MTTKPNPAASEPLVQAVSHLLRQLDDCLHENDYCGLSVSKHDRVAVDDAIEAVRADLATPVHQVAEPLCACKDRPASQCDEEWGPNCDLGNNAAHVHVSQTDPKLIDTAPKAAEPAPNDGLDMPEGDEAHEAWVSACEVDGIKHSGSSFERGWELALSNGVPEWPTWANQVLEAVRAHSGYDGYDDPDGVDIVAEVTECLGELAAMADRARAALTAPPAAPEPVLASEWISVDEKLPTKHGQHVLVLTANADDDPHAVTACWNGARLFLGMFGRKVEPVTHWMPIPAAPVPAAGEPKKA